MSFYNSLYNNSPIAIQNILVSAYGYAWKKRRFGGIFLKELKLAKERESFSVNQWNDFENQKLQEILLHAFKNVSYYNKSFKAAGLTESLLKKIQKQDIASIPILSKQHLREFGTNTLLSTIRESKGNFYASSGSTGTPTQILYSHAMHQRWSAIFEARIRHWAGVDRFSSRGMIGGRRVVPNATSKGPFYRYNFFENQVYFSAYHINATNTPNYIQAINKYRLDYMTGYAMSNYFLARFIQESGLKVNEQKALITSSEKLTKEMRSLFKEVYGCKTFDSWSGVEACGLVSECEYGSLHVSPDAGIIELLDDDYNPVPPNTFGNVYCTGFLNNDQPLIRYSIGDTMMMSNESCKCERKMPIIQEIGGRVEDIVIGKDGREMVRFHAIFNGLSTVSKSQVIQESVDELIIKVVPSQEIVSDSEKQIMKQRVQSQLGEINIIIEEVPSIPLTDNGKFKAVISKVKRKTIH